MTDATAAEYRRKLADLSEAQIAELGVARNTLEKRIAELEAEHAQEREQLADQQGLAITVLRTEIADLERLTKEIAEFGRLHRPTVELPPPTGFPGPETGVVMDVPLGAAVAREHAGRPS